MSVIEWIQKRNLHLEPWFLLGKGPSFDKRDLFGYKSFPTLALNHTCLFHEATLAHFTDWDAFLECCKSISSVTTVVLPWYPHVDNKPGSRSLGEFLKESQTLRLLSKEKRLLSYNSTLAADKKGSLPTIKVRYFSAVAGLSILAKSGVKRVYSLGIDGGDEYASCFDNSNLLKNGRPNFDVQFRELKRISKKYKLLYRPCLPEKSRG